MAKTSYLYADKMVISEEDNEQTVIDRDYLVAMLVKGLGGKCSKQRVYFDDAKSEEWVCDMSPKKIGEKLLEKEIAMHKDVGYEYDPEIHDFGVLLNSYCEVSGSEAVRCYRWQDGVPEMNIQEGYMLVDMEDW